MARTDHTFQHTDNSFTWRYHVVALDCWLHCAVLPYLIKKPIAQSGVVICEFDHVSLTVVQPCAEQLSNAPQNCSVQFLFSEENRWKISGLFVKFSILLPISENSRRVTPPSHYGDSCDGRSSASFRWYCYHCSHLCICIACDFSGHCALLHQISHKKSYRYRRLTNSRRSGKPVHLRCQSPLLFRSTHPLLYFTRSSPSQLLVLVICVGGRKNKEATCNLTIFKQWCSMEVPAAIWTSAPTRQHTTHKMRHSMRLLWRRRYILRPVSLRNEIGRKLRKPAFCSSSARLGICNILCQAFHSILVYQCLHYLKTTQGRLRCDCLHDGSSDSYFPGIILAMSAISIYLGQNNHWCLRWLYKSLPLRRDRQPSHRHEYRSSTNASSLEPEYGT